MWQKKWKLYDFDVLAYVQTPAQSVCDQGRFNPVTGPWAWLSLLSTTSYTSTATNRIRTAQTVTAKSSLPTTNYCTCIHSIYTSSTLHLYYIFYITRTSLSNNVTSHYKISAQRQTLSAIHFWITANTTTKVTLWLWSGQVSISVLTRPQVQHGQWHPHRLGTVYGSFGLVLIPEPPSVVISCGISGFLVRRVNTRS